MWSDEDSVDYEAETPGVLTNRIKGTLEQIDQCLKDMGIDPEILSKSDPGFLHASREEALVEARIWILRSLKRKPKPLTKPKRRRSKPKRRCKCRRPKQKR